MKGLASTSMVRKQRTKRCGTTAPLRTRSAHRAVRAVRTRTAQDPPISVSVAAGRRPMRWGTSGPRLGSDGLPSPLLKRIPMTRKRLVRIAVTAAVGLTIAGAVAYAAWSVNGSGRGSASAATAQNLTLTAGSASSALYPGATADVDTSVANSNPFPVHVTSLALDTTKGQNGFDVDAGHGGCNLSALSFTAATNGGNGWDV